MNVKQFNSVSFFASKLQGVLPFVCSDVLDFIACQSALETGYFKSKVYLVCNNAFGMHYPNRRPTLASSVVLNHACYKSITDSILDYLLWCTYLGCSQDTFKDLFSFTKFLRGSRFNPSPKYVDTIFIIYHNFKSFNSASYEKDVNC